jgi:hypothetical protein
MEKFKSASELKKKAKEAFEFHENAEVLHVTTDGQCFLEQSKNSAIVHARRNDLKVTTFTRAEIIGESDSAQTDSEAENLETSKAAGNNAGEEGSKAVDSTLGNATSGNSGKASSEDSDADTSKTGKKEPAPKAEKAGKPGKSGK